MVEAKLNGDPRPESPGEVLSEMRRYVVLLKLLEEFKKRRSRCFETHFQRGKYFLQQMMGVPLGYDFYIYRQSPYADDLNDEFTGMRADRYVAVKPLSEYGPSLFPTDSGLALFDRYSKTLERDESAIQFVADRLARIDVLRLGRTGAALRDIQLAEGRFR